MIQPGLETAALRHCKTSLSRLTSKILISLVFEISSFSSFFPLKVKFVFINTYRGPIPS